MGSGEELSTSSHSSNWMPPDPHVSDVNCKIQDKREDEPGNRLESLIRSINANRGKWFKKARHVSSVALSEIINIRAEANVR